MREQDYSEKRKYARLDIRSRVNISIMETPEGERPVDRFQAIGENIGVEGIKLNTSEQLDTGMVLDLEIYMPGQKEPISLEGEVRWCNPAGTGEDGEKTYDVGVKFLDVDKNHVLMLIKYLCGNLGENEHHLHL